MIKFEWVDRKEEKNKSTHGDLGGLRNVQQVPNVLFAVVTMDEVKSVDCIIWGVEIQFLVPFAEIRIGMNKNLDLLIEMKTCHIY